jgi:hypothetical protein
MVAVRASTGYLLTVTSMNFFSQPDRRHLLETVKFLSHERVPPAHIKIALPVVAGVTVNEPRPHVGCPALKLPPGYEGCVTMEVESMLLDFQQELIAFAQNAAIAQIVWMFWDHSSLDGLRFPPGPDGNAKYLTPSDLYTLLNRCLNKPLLAILDACQSGKFAKSLLKYAPALRVPIGFLTSSDAQCACSLAVISSDENTGLPACPLKPTEEWLTEHSEVDRAFANGYVGIRFGHSMFSRAGLREVAYSPADLPLMALVGVLNVGQAKDPSRGFDAEFLPNGPVAAAWHLREFFPGPVSPDDQDADGVHFRDIVLPEALGEVYDDTLTFKERIREGGPGIGAGYVQINSKNGLDDRHVGSKCIEDTGFIGQATSPLATYLTALLQQFPAHVDDDGGGTRREKKPNYVSLQAMSFYLWKKYFEPGPGKYQWDASGALSSEVVERVQNIILDVNGITELDDAGLGSLACCLCHVTDEAEIRTLIAEAQNAFNDPAMLATKWWLPQKKE